MISGSSAALSWRRLEADRETSSSSPENNRTLVASTGLAMHLRTLHQKLASDQFMAKFLARTPVASSIGVLPTRHPAPKASTSPINLTERQWSYVGIEPKIHAISPTA